MSGYQDGFGAPVVPAATQVSIVAEGNGRRIKTSNYEAMVDGDGMLPSLNIGGQDFLTTNPGIPRGIYLYQSGLLLLRDIAPAGDRVLIARGDRASIRYEFGLNSIGLTVANLTEKPLSYYAALDTGVSAFFDSAGRAIKTPANQESQSTVTWFKSGSKLKMEGGNHVFGPWGNGLQIWECIVPPGETRQVLLTPGQATAAELDNLLHSAATAPTTATEPADVAAPKMGPDGQLNAYFKARHETILGQMKDGTAGLIFVGDSITNRWNSPANKPLWDARFGPLHAVNLGIEGDRTQHVLWRFEHGELEGIAPQVAVVLIGTNNMGYPVAEIVKGDTKIVAELHRRLPTTKVLLLGIFPRGPLATDPVRAKIKAINSELAKLDNGDDTRFMDFGDQMLQPDGSISPTMMPDGVHPNYGGYKIWADAIAPLLQEMTQ